MRKISIIFIKSIDYYTHNAYNIIIGRDNMRFREIEKILKDDGWIYKNSRGSHNYYIHPTKPGKVTIPNHPGDIHPITIKSILKQAGLG